MFDKNDIKKALIKAIKDYPINDLVNEDFLNDCALEYVCEHEEDIKALLYDLIDLSDDFEKALGDIWASDIF